jgi:membrane-associated phospholipid phosphatase
MEQSTRFKTHHNIALVPALQYYLLPLFIFWLIAACLLFNMGYQGSFLFLNEHYQSWLDIPMLYITYLGDSLIISCIITLLIWYKSKPAVITMIAAVIISGIFIQLCKHIFFAGWNRPPLVFEHIQSIHTVADYRLYYFSFPSGHSATIASVFTVLAFEWRQKTRFVVLAFLLTILISYTRVYTGVHFLGDVLASSIIGTVVALFCIHYFYKKLVSYFEAAAQKIIKIWNFALYILAFSGLLFSFGHFI